LQMWSACLTCTFEVMVGFFCPCMFFPVLSFLLFILPSCFLTHGIKPGRQVFCPPVRIFVLLDLDGLYYSRFNSFCYQELFDHLRPCFVVLLILVWYLPKVLCELVCGGVRLPFLRAAHIFGCVFSSYPLIFGLIVRTWWLCGAWDLIVSVLLRSNRKMYKIRTRISTTRNINVCIDESVVR
jgi:hypothetical protein